MIRDYDIKTEFGLSEKTRKQDWGGERVSEGPILTNMAYRRKCVKGQREMKSRGVLRSGPGCQGEQPFPVDLRLNSGPWPPLMLQAEWGAAWRGVFRVCCEFEVLWVDVACQKVELRIDVWSKAGGDINVACFLTIMLSLASV